MFLKLLRLQLKITEVTTEHQKMSKNKHKQRETHKKGVQHSAKKINKWVGRRDLLSDFQPLVLKVCSEQENSSALAVKQETVQYICLPVHYAESPLRIVRFKFAIPSLDNSTVLSLPLSILTRRYGPLCGPTSSSYRGHRPSANAFLPFGQKKSLLCCLAQFLVIFGVQYRLFQKSVPLSVKLTR